MRVTVAGLEIEAEPGVPVRALVAFARERGTVVPERPWCGPTRLLPDHPVGLSPLVAFARLGSVPGPDARPQLGVHLAVVGGPDAGAVATLAEGLTIGRDEASGLRLTDPTVSWAHARLAGTRVRDLGSRNGITVAGRRVLGRARVRAGDTIRLGDSVVQLHDPAATDSETPQRASALTMATGGAASLTMVVFAVASGHWLLGLAAIAVPLTAAAAARSRRPAPAPAFDVTATLGLDPLADGPVAVHGSRGLVRAVTLATGRPASASRQWEAWMGLLPAAGREVTWLERGEEPPSWTQVLVREGERTVAVSAHGVTAHSPLPLVSAATAEATARRIASRAEAAALPNRVTWGQLPAPPGELPVRLGLGPTGPMVLDLVADGPHLLVAGTTGSGKSEALRTIIASLAYDRPPDQLSFALVDFKGGAGLAPCAVLPHVASVLTDLEPHLARRCLLALTAELAARKRAIAAAGATAYDEWRGKRPPRLVVVVDEFQEIAAADREFLPQLARLAAQGRSLGMHLVLATQRPAGAVGAEIRANIGATLALRTASESESHDLIGAADAARIPADVPGRALLLRSGGIEQVQVAVAVAVAPPPIRAWGEPPPQGRSLIDAACERHAGGAAPLWLPPLPTSIAPVGTHAAATPASGFVLGIADQPARRLREALTWDPASGPLVVAGPPRSGKTSALRAVCALAQRAGLTPVWLPATPRLAARTLALALDLPDALLVVDDAARALSAAATAEPEAPDLLATAIHRLPVALVAPPGWANHRLAASAGLRLVVTGLSDADDAAWDVPRELRALPAARGRVRAHDASGWREAQLALPARWTERALVRSLPTVAPPGLPPTALGIGGDEAVPILIRPLESAVVGPQGEERDAVSRRVSLATGIPPLVAESPFAFGGPGGSLPTTIVVVRPTARSVREVARQGVLGLVEPSPVPLRAVVVIDGVASAVQVLSG